MDLLGGNADLFRRVELGSEIGELQALQNGKPRSAKTKTRANRVLPLAAAMLGLFGAGGLGWLIMGK